MASEPRILTAEQHFLLSNDIANGDRVQYYLRLFEYTGSQVALYMSQISSSSEVPGGIAFKSTKGVSFEYLFEDQPCLVARALN